MKSINTYILEKFKIDKDIKVTNLNEVKKLLTQNWEEHYKEVMDKNKYHSWAYSVDKSTYCMFFELWNNGTVGIPGYPLETKYFDEEGNVYDEKPRKVDILYAYPLVDYDKNSFVTFFSKYGSHREYLQSKYDKDFDTAFKCEYWSNPFPIKWTKETRKWKEISYEEYKELKEKFDI